MNTKDIKTHRDLTEEQIKTCEEVLKWCSEAEFIQFNEKDLQTILSRTTNICRWNQNLQMLSLPLVTEE